MEHVLLENRSTSTRFGPFTLLRRPHGVIFAQGNASLRAQPMRGGVDMQGQGGPYAQWRIEERSGGVCIINVGLASKRLAERAGELVLATGDDDVSLWAVLSHDGAPPTHDCGDALRGLRPFDEAVDFSRDERRAFVRDGFVVARAAVSCDLVDAARAAINRRLCQPGAVVADETTGLRFCAAAAGDSAVRALLMGSSAWTLAQRLLGRGQARWGGGAQIALRPPDGDGTGGPPRAAEEAAHPPTRWHIDGMGQGRHSPFSLLVGVALSAQPAGGGHGNLRVFRGSHATLQPRLKEQVASGSGIWSNERDDTKPALDGGFDVALEPGDVVFCHQKTAHAIGRNRSADIRYQVYFRLSHAQHAEHLASGAVLDDLWVEFEGLREEAGAAWACSACTFENPPHRSSCEMCESPRGGG